MFHNNIVRKMATKTWQINSNSIQLAIKLLMLVILLGYIMIWIMMPTNLFWLHWLPNIRAKTDSTYFGQKGANILIYTFPILFIAILGCLYLHLDKYGGRHLFMQNFINRKHSYRTSLSQPVIVKGPLGIVSGIEVFFLVAFVSLLVWSISAYMYQMFKNISKESASKMEESVWEVRLESVALLLGLVGNICLAFLFFPVARGSSILRQVGLTSESSIKYHIWLGHTALALFTAHGLCFVVFWASTHQISEVLKWDKVGPSNVAGEVALLSGIAIWITSQSPVRRKLFELFFYTHHLYLVFILFFIFHVSFSYSCIMLPGFYLFLIDRLLRFLQSQQRVSLISARTLPCNAIELNFAKDSRLTYNPSSIIFINVKNVSKLQWHPFTVTSNHKTDPDQLSVVVKCEGSWSKKLYEILSSPTPADRLEVSIEGPYSPAPNTYLRSQALVMVSGGSGVTPFISIIRELIYLSNMNHKIPRLLLVAVFKKSADLSMLDFILPLSGTSQDASRLQLQIVAYITRDRSPSTDNQKLPRSIFFKGSDLEQPITSVLGPNSWLWLGAIISSSFVIFLLLLALVHRYYIYPIDHNSNQIYSQAATSTISLVFLCVSVMITATISFLWNKKQYKRITRQIQTTETPTPTATPATESWHYMVDRELESVPHQSFTEATEVHYGKRPNLKNILSECKESNVSVLVSGPKKMRHDVAAICSSSLAKNLHYECFSFNW
ncbi:ferric reduction oxidase 2-like isoform X2 [Andrographis paniculata]|uniref:ferric reduction oxidase 2-like isoform X2 n=1 Tax=Andrographis paniculata TaxID=175694 RepID=UPI0021E956B1|nr:ferric reduction oxidase 2-like isoform X2 [Andrographis paniculata]